jgi:hypothetical protein
MRLPARRRLTIAPAAAAPGRIPRPPLRVPMPRSVLGLCARRRGLAILLTTLGFFGIGAGLWAYFTAPSQGPGASTLAGTVGQVTGLAVPAANPTADPAVALSWDAAQLSNGGAVHGYEVKRYSGSTPTAVCSSPVSGTSCTDAGAPDGSYSYGITGKFYGWLGPESTRVSVTVDTTPPSITSKPSTPSADASPSFAFTHPSYSTFRCRLDGAASFVPCSSPQSYSGLADGLHTFRVEALDASDVPTQAASYSWTIDRAAPTFTSKPASTSANPSPSFGFTHADYTSLQCQVDGGGFASCSSPTTLSNLSDGSHTFDVQAIDADGAGTTPASYTWTVDTSAPTITVRPSNPSATSAPSFGFMHAAASYTFSCKLDGVRFAACTSPKSYVGLADGSHTFTVEAIDADGFAASSTASVTWMVDTSAPSITSHPTDPSSNPSPSFSFGHGSYSSFQCRLDAASYSACSSPKSYSSLAEGSHTFDVRAVDADGATTASASFGWLLDSVPPSTTLATTPANPDGNNDWFKRSSVTFTLGATDPSPGSGVASSFYTVDGGSTQTYTGTVTIASQGNHTIQYWSTDNAGNTETANTTHIKLDNVNPTGSVTAPSSGANVSGSVTVSSSNAADSTSGVASAQFQYATHGGSTWTNIGSPATSGPPYSRSWDTTAVANGAYDLRALVTDNAGNSLSTSLVTDVTVGNTYGFALSNPGAQTAGSALGSFTVQLQVNGSNTGSFNGASYAGSHTIGWSGSATAAAPDGSAATPTSSSLSFSASGQAPVPAGTITLFNAAAGVVLTATDGAQSISGSSGTFSVGAGTASKLAWTSVSADAGTQGSTLCLFTCTWNNIGRGNHWSAKVSVTDNWGNVVSNIGSGHSVSFAHSGGGAWASGSLTFPATGAATTSSNTFTSNGSNSWSSEALTASSSGFSNATATLNK